MIVSGFVRQSLTAFKLTARLHDFQTNQLPDRKTFQHIPFFYYKFTSGFHDGFCLPNGAMSVCAKPIDSSKFNGMDDLKGQEVKEYIAAARDYCFFIDETASVKPVELFESLQNLLPRIYSKTSQIKKPKYCYEDEPQKFVQENEYALIHDRLRGIISRYNSTGSLKQGNKGNGMDILSFSLAEALADIYQELKDSCDLYEVGLTQAMNDAIWSIRDSFEKQWGLQLIETLQSIHQLLYGHQLTSSQLQFNNEGDEAAKMDESWFSEEDDIPYDEE